MSNVYINRNRSQGNYAFDIPGTKLKQQDGNEIFDSTKKTWYSRASKEQTISPDQRFNRTSLKYGKNPTQQETYVGVPWSIVDTCQTIKKPSSGKQRKTQEASGGWKRYSQYDTLNPHEKYRRSVKDGLKEEINNIAMDLAIKREASYLSPNMMSPKNIRDQFNSTYNRTNSNWQSPKVESIERSFNEGARFFSNFKEGREHGLKFVQPPLAECNLQQLKDEAKQAEKVKEMQSTLLNDFYTYQPSSSSKGKNTERYQNRNLSMLMAEADKESKFRKTQTNNYNQLFADRNVTKGQKFADSRRFETTDAQALQYMNSQTTHGRILKFADQIVRFPKKERFNQDLDESVKEIKKTMVEGPKTLNSTLLAGKNGDLLSQFDKQSKRSSQRSKYTNFSKISTLTKDELQRYFKDKKDQLEEDSKSRITAISQGQFHKIQQRRQSMANKKVKDLNESISPDRKGFLSAENTEDVEEVEEISYNSDLDDQDAKTMATNQVLGPDNIEIVDAENTNDGTFDENTQDYDDLATDGATKLTASAEREIEGLLGKIEQEKSQRHKLQFQIQEMRDKSDQQAKIVEINQSNPITAKLMNQDQRNLMQSAQNYTTHCDFS